jgi:hypothetical protein
MGLSPQTPPIAPLPGGYALFQIARLPLRSRCVFACYAKKLYFKTRVLRGAASLLRLCFALCLELASGFAYSSNSGALRCFDVRASHFPAYSSIMATVKCSGLQTFVFSALINCKLRKYRLFQWKKPLEINKFMVSCSSGRL